MTVSTAKLADVEARRRILITLLLKLRDMP